MYSLAGLLTMTGTVVFGFDDDACLASRAAQLAPAAVRLVVGAADGSADLHHVTVEVVTGETL